MTDTAIELLDRMNRHLSIMQCQMRQYLEPSGRGVGFSHDNKARADQFINDMICLLDGPEQRDVQDKARALLKSRLTDMTAQKDELPPCPFCGNEPVLLTATEWDGFERYTEVRCDHCGISIDNEYKADAIAAWKHRTPTASPDSGMVEKLREALELIRAMLSQHSGSQSLLGDAFKVADAALQPQDVPTNGDAGTGARADEKLTDDLNDILQPFHWEAWKAALFSDHPDGWPDDDEQDAICQRVDSMAVGEHYQAWSEEVQEKIVSLFSHRLQSTAELRAKLEDANSLLSDWLKIGNNMAERRAIRDRARTFLASMEGRGGE